MNNQTMNIDGAICMWSLADSSYLNQFRAGLIDLGHEDHLPNARTFAACLKDALREVCGASTTLIRPLVADGSTEGFAVITEQRGTDGNEYNRELIAKVTNEPRIKLRPYDQRAQPITDAFNRQLGLIKPASITASLTGIIGNIGGTTLRPHGGVYWLPNYALNQWRQVSELVEQCGHDGKNCMYIARHQLDHDAVRMVHDAIVKEIRSDVRRISQEIMDGELGDRALETRKVEAYAMRSKIKEYAEILQSDLSYLLEEVEKTETSIAQATMIGAGVDSGAA